MAAEKNFENKVKDWLSNQGAWFIKYWGGAKFTKDGIPDILVCFRGKFIAIEVKGPKGRPSVLQLITLKKIREAGGIGVLLYPEHFDYFIAYLTGTELGAHWYRENKEMQKEWFEKLTL